jgi:ABC-type lipoprotein export system ATPase subunit
MQYKEFVRTSLHNHFGTSSAERTLNDPVDKCISYDMNDCYLKIDSAYKEGFTMLGLTNANCIPVELYAILSVYAKEKGILILPGIELNLKSQNTGKYMHVVVIFDPNSPILSTSIQIDKYIKGHTQPYLTIEEFVNLNTKTKCIVIPHAIKQNRSERSASTNPDLIQELLAYDCAIPLLLDGTREFHKQQLIHKLSYDLSEYELDIISEINIVSTADRADFSEVIDPTFIWGENTFESLYYASLMGGERFVRESDRYEKERYISRIELIPNSEGELVKNKDLMLSHGLNSIIGSSGSGKTLLLNFIFRELTGQNIENLTSSDANYDSIYRNVDLNLYDNFDNLIEQGTINVLEGDNLYQILTMNYKDKRDEMLERFEIEIDNSKFLEVITEFNSKCNKYIELTTKYNALKNEINELIRNLVSNQTSLKLNKENSRFSIKYTYDSNINSELRKLELNRKTYQSDIESLRNAFVNINDIGNRYNASKLVSSIKLKLAELKKIIDIEKYKNEININILLEKQSIYTELTERVEQYNQLTGKAGAIVVTAMQEISDDLVKIYDKTLEMIEVKESILIPTLDFSKLKECLSKGITQSDFTNISIKDLDYIVDKNGMKVLFNNNVSQNKSNSKLGMGSFDSDFELDLSSKISVRNMLSIFIENKYENKIYLNEDYRNYFELGISIKVGENAYQDVTKLSAGQLGKAYFKSMIEKNIRKKKVNVLFFDQPENNLEKDFILNDLSKLLNKLKKNIQIVITTHEPLLVVNADTNKIIVCENQKNINAANNIKYINMTLSDSVGIEAAVEKISRLVDGSTRAIRKRNYIYGGLINEN